LATRKLKQSKPDDLLDQVIRLTGIPSALIKKELKATLKKHNLDAKQLTLPELRTVVASYLRDIVTNMIDGSTTRKS